MAKCLCCGHAGLISTPATLAPFVAERTGVDQACHTLTCAYCGFSFLDIRFTDAQMFALYHDYRGPEYVEQRERHEHGYKARNDELSKPCSWKPKIETFLGQYATLPVKMLDWGGDTGINSPFEGNRELHIYDIGNKPVIDGALKITEPRGYYDLIVCASVLEHLPDPAEVVSQISHIEHALIYFDVPVENRKRDRWHEHINVFNLYCLAILFKRCGVQVIDYQYLTDPSMLMVVCK